MGNVGYPIILRLIIVVLQKICHWFHLDESAALYEYILMQPRQCLTHLFPARETWILLVLLLVYLVAAPLIIMGLEWNGQAFQPILSKSSGFYKWLNSLFQVVQVRTSGPNSLPIAELTGASLILLAGAMYLSAYPLTIVMRTSNEQLKTNHEKTSRYQLTKMLSYDFVVIFLPWFLIAILEGPLSDTDLFAIFFEIVTAYGTVGCSIGAPNVNYSLSGTWSVTSKLIIIAIMLIGKHRGMPDDVDGAFNDWHSDDEEEDSVDPGRQTSRESA